MLQSCETLITKINEWQKAILELERLSDEFLNSGDEKIKEKIENQKKEVEKQGKEYLDLAYSELPNGEKLFWPEKELLAELFRFEHNVLHHVNTGAIIVKNNHISKLFVGATESKTNLSLFNRLEIVDVFGSFEVYFPLLPKSIKYFSMRGIRNIEIPNDLSNFGNLEFFDVSNTNLEKLPSLPKSIKKIWAISNPFSSEEKERIKREYPNTKIEF